MDVKQDANIEAEGQFGKPEFFARWLFEPSRQHWTFHFSRSGVNARMDTKFPHHPLMPSEAAYKKNVEAAELNMLSKTMGAAMPLQYPPAKSLTAFTSGRKVTQSFSNPENCYDITRQLASFKAIKFTKRHGVSEWVSQSVS